MSGGRALLLLALLAGAAQGQMPVRDGLSFEELPDLPDAIGFGGPIVGTHQGTLVVAGGANFPTPLAEGGDKVWHAGVYLLPEGESAWREGPELPMPLAYAACASTERGIVVAGGSDADSVRAEVHLLRWEPATERLVFDELPPLPVPSAFGAAEAIGDAVYLLGGKRSKSDGDLSGGFWRLELDAPQRGWIPLTPPPGPTRFKAVTAVQRGPDGERSLYLFSGSRVSETAAGELRFEMFTDAYRFAPENGTWTRLADLPALDDPRSIPGEERFAGERWPINAGCAWPWGERQILTFGGSTGRYILDEGGQLVPPAQRPPFASRVLTYDTVADAWFDTGSMPLGVVTTRAALWDGRIVIPSGEVRPGIRTPMVQALALPERTAAGLGRLDYVVLGAYLALMVAVGAYFARRETSTHEFFLAGRKIPWWAAGLSIFGTQLSAITFMAIPATSFGSDWRRFVGQLALLPVFVLVITCFLPFFRRLELTTAYEYLEKRFSLAVRLIASALFILFQFGRMGIVLLLPAIALSAVSGVDTYLCIALMGVLATVYTALGGISAVIWTDVLQVFVLLGGALLCLVITIHDAGGVGPLIETAQAAGKLQVFDWRWSTSEMVAWVLIVGFLFTNIVPYTTDQTVIQRYLTTRDEKQAAKGLWLNFAMTVPAGLLFFGLGTALFVYYTAHPVEHAFVPEKADQLVPWFVVTHLPAGVAGLVIAGVFAAAMSSLDSSMNSISTALLHDFVQRFQPEERRRDRLRLARMLTVLLGVVGTGTAMVLATYEIKYLFDFFQKVLGLFGGGLAGVFLLGVFTRRTNATGALTGLTVGGLATLGVAFFTSIHFLLYAAVGTLVCLVVGYLVGITTGGRDRDLSGLTLADRRS